MKEERAISEEYIKRLLELTEELKQYRDTTDSKDYNFLSKLDYLIGYISALKPREKTEKTIEDDYLDPL